MINDGQGWKPASEVNASLRAAQEARAAQAANPPAPKVAAPATMPSSGLNQAAMDAHWTPERREASRKEEKRMRDEYQAKEDAAAEAVRNKPKLKTDAEYREQHRIRSELARINERQKQREADDKANAAEAKAGRGKSFGPGPGMHTDYDADPKTGELIEKTVHSKTGVVISEKRNKSLAYPGQKTLQRSMV